MELLSLLVAIAVPLLGGSIVQFISSVVVMSRGHYE